MGYLLPAGAMGRQLTWGDFSKRNNPAPAPGKKVTAAFTSVVRKISVKTITFAKADYLKPPNYKMVQDPDVIIEFDPASWVENWVFNKPQAFQDSLLAHEQGHYDIAYENAGVFALHRDCAAGSFGLRGCVAVVI